MSSVVQMRCSIPLFWSQEASRFSPKPDIISTYRFLCYRSSAFCFSAAGFSYNWWYIFKAPTIRWVVSVSLEWILEYHQSRPGVKILQDRIDDLVSHVAKLEQERKERETLAAKGGWTVVVHQKGRKKTTESESGTAKV